MAEYSTEFKDEDVKSDSRKSWEQELEEERLAEEMEKAKRERQRQAEDFAYRIEKEFEERAGRRAVIEQGWLTSGRLFYGSLATNNAWSENTDRPFDYAKTPARPDKNIVRNKCEIAIAQAVSMQFGAGDKNWDILPDPESDKEDAMQRARAMSLVLEAQLDKCDYPKKAREAIRDRIIYGTGILKGPVSIGKLTTKWEEIPGTGTWQPVVQEQQMLNIDRVPFWNFYPDDTVNDFNKCKDAIELHCMDPMELKQFMKHPGFDADAIREVLKTKPVEYNENAYNDLASLSNSNPYLFKDKYLVLEYHGPITVDQLGNLGIECPDYDTPTNEYFCEAWVCGGKVIRLQLETIEGQFELPYAMCVWVEDPASVFGRGAPLLMKDAQQVVTQVWHMILDNAAISSGPQVTMHRNMVEPANGKWEFAPRQVWLMRDSSASVQHAMQMFFPPNNVEMLALVKQMAEQHAEEESTTSLITAGIESPQIADSATGTAMVMQASTKILDYLNEAWDDYVTEKIIRRCVAYNIQYHEDNNIKDNFDVDVRTSSAYRDKQVQTQNLEKLTAMATQNPALAEWLNMDTISQAWLSSMNIPFKNIIKTPDEVAAEREARAQQPDPAMMELELKAQANELKSKELDIKQQQLELEKTFEMQKAAWEHEETLASIWARGAESQARVLESQNEKEIKLIELMMRSEDQNQKNALMERIAVMGNEVKMFLGAMQQTSKARDQLLTEREMEYAEKEGKGI